MNSKEILFRASQKRPDATIPFRRAQSGLCANDIIGWDARLPVNLDALSPVARFIAEHTCSTFNSGSVMRCTSRKTDAEMLAESGTKPERIEALRRAYGDMIDEPVVQDLAYGTLEPGVTPEEFFEKVAARVAHCSRMIRMDRDGYPTLQHEVSMEIPIHIVFNKMPGEENRPGDIWYGEKGTIFTLINTHTGKAHKDCFIPVVDATDVQCKAAFTSECMAKIDY